MDDATPRATFDAQLVSGDVTFDARDVQLLRAIDEHGSLNAAATALGRSYAHAQRRVVTLEDGFGPLVRRERGGTSGGGSTLTDEARRLIQRFRRLTAESSGLADVDETVLVGTVAELDGEFGLVETDVGVVRALVPADADAVEVPIRSDVITLYSPDAAPQGDDTSARNQFSGTVAAVEEGERIARITVNVGGETPLLALVTMNSVERLGLEPGRPVVASFKATTTRAVPVELGSE
ncbi:MULTISPECIES: TOBE domain-containing protein [unclassified Haladaptatus]|uniref:TOBE domain-containing protein n=1 Tax=unclassified Haladaptatus TaxID=2622732 RepID=UPI00209C1FBE|nr:MULTISPECIES: TOBE domain-containing protein [unclassified Haladaptatus]MCO8246227.1 TOBE domain-containing protein [Haladaptatus sp. AB643]MCO8254152.1 TOBE domain-containing protein [Haladaptatus sp. AB618]